MTINTVIHILTKIKKAKRGALFFCDNFISISNSDALRKALERLVKAGELVRVASGIYVRLEIDPVIGTVTPGIDAIAKAITCICYLR